MVNGIVAIVDISSPACVYTTSDCCDDVAPRQPGIPVLMVGGAEKCIELLHKLNTLGYKPMYFASSEVFSQVMKLQHARRMLELRTPSPAPMKAINAT